MPIFIKTFLGILVAIFHAFAFGNRVYEACGAFVAVICGFADLAEIDRTGETLPTLTERNRDVVTSLTRVWASAIISGADCFPYVEYKTFWALFTSVKTVRDNNIT